MTMQIPQLTYNDTPEAAYPGQVADLSQGTQTDSMSAEVALDSGVFVVTGAAGIFHLERCDVGFRDDAPDPTIRCQQDIQ